MKRAIVGTLLAIALLASLLLIYFDERRRAAVLYATSPSAAEALALGQLHFDSERPEYYDIEKAEQYLSEAYALDPDHLYVNHERARIEFLKGNFDEAMRYIDREIELRGERFPNAFYIRGLIEGYMGRYHAAALDYAVYLKHDPSNWAAINDFAWVLLKADRTEDALSTIRRGLEHFPRNPWLLNSEAIALYELGEYEKSLMSALLATSAAENVTRDVWLRAYPGNDPRTAEAGIVSLRESIDDNMHMLALTLSLSEVQ